jgi:hypothetical protein
MTFPSQTRLTGISFSTVGPARSYIDVVRPGAQSCPVVMVARIPSPSDRLRRDESGQIASRPGQRLHAGKLAALTLGRRRASQSALSRAAFSCARSSDERAGGVTDTVTHCGGLGPTLRAERTTTNVNIKLATATLGAALILAGSPAFAADIQSEPINIHNVAVYAGNTDPDNVITRGSVAIAFTNEYKFPATEVVFALETSGYAADRFDDVGSFATGVTINHVFGENLANPGMRVAVEKATFADGMVWLNPNIPQATQSDTSLGVAVDGPF